MGALASKSSNGVKEELTQIISDIKLMKQGLMSFERQDVGITGQNVSPITFY